MNCNIFGVLGGGGIKVSLHAILSIPDISGISYDDVF